MGALPRPTYLSYMSPIFWGRCNVLLIDVHSYNKLVYIYDLDLFHDKLILLHASYLHCHSWCRTKREFF